MLGSVLKRKFKDMREFKSKRKGSDDETARLLEDRPNSSSHQSYSSANVAGDHLSATEAPPSYREVFSPYVLWSASRYIADIENRQSNINLLAYSILALHSVAYDQLLPVFMHLPPEGDVQSPFKFAFGFGLDVGLVLAPSSLSRMLSPYYALVRAYRSTIYTVLVFQAFLT
jgi:hypothetical protein